MTTFPLVPPLVPAEAPLSATGGSATDAGFGPAGDPDWTTVSDALGRTLDAREGFEKMAELAEPDFRPTVQRFLDLHTRHGEELARLLADAGVSFDAGGSIMGRVNRMVVTARALSDDIDADVLHQIHSGEAHVVAAYETALQARLPEAAHRRVARLLDELNRLLAGTRPKG